MNGLQSYSPIGKFISLTYQNPHVLDDDHALQDHLKKLIDTLKSSIKKDGIDLSQKKMEDDLFSIRFKLLAYLHTHPDLLKNFENTIIEQIGRNYFASVKFKELGNAISDSLEVYLMMFGKLADELKKNISNIDTMLSWKKEELKLSSLRHINALQPNPDLTIVIEWFSASVRYDFYLIAAEFIMNGDIPAEADEVIQLGRFLKKSIIDFGKYTILSGLWKPGPEDESALIRNMKIEVAAHNLSSGSGKSISLQQLQNHLLS